MCHTGVGRKAVAIRQLNGIKALREDGDPTELLRKLKETLFAA